MPQRISKLTDMVKSPPICFHRRLKNLPRPHDNMASPSVASLSLPAKFPDKGMIWGLSNFMNQSGFTLIELLIAIAIVVILATIAVPNVLAEMPKFRLNGAAQQLLGDLMTARMKAVSNNRRVQMFFTGGNTYKICDDADNNGTVDNCEGNARTINIQDNYKGVTLTSNNNPIFSPRGTASNLATISIQNSSGTKSITISITGRIQTS